ncbi:hypothetical protein Vafri_518 [Volvox africanus]|nr:hypothetical protein Vafri_518 [Volvox africanus]
MHTSRMMMSIRQKPLSGGQTRSAAFSIPAPALGIRKLALAQASAQLVHVLLGSCSIPFRSPCAPCAMPERSSMPSKSGAAGVEAVQNVIQEVKFVIKEMELRVSKTRDKIEAITKNLQIPSVRKKKRAALEEKKKVLQTTLQMQSETLQMQSETLLLLQQLQMEKEQQLQQGEKEQQLQEGAEDYLKLALRMGPPSKIKLSRDQLSSSGLLIKNWRPSEEIAGGELPELIHPVFARVSDILAGNMAVDKEAITTAATMCCIGAGIYDNETEPTGKIWVLLGQYLADIPAVKVKSGFADLGYPDWALGDSPRDPANLFLIYEAKSGLGGSGDSHFQGANYHLQFWLKRTNSRIFKETCCPAFLLEVVGPHVRLSALAWVDRVTLFPLTPLLNLLPVHPRTACLLMPVARLLMALREGVRELAMIHASPAVLQQPTVPKHVGLPWPIRLSDRYNAMSAVKLTAYNPTYYVRRAAAGGASKVMPVEVVVKLCRNYGLEAHMAWAAIGLAPKVLHSEQLPGGWLLIEMELLPMPGWRRLSDLPGTEAEEALHSVNKSLEKAHMETNMVHGDVRPPNCLVWRCGPMDAGPWQVRFVDFEWAGRQGEATYPACLNPTIPWPTGVDYGEKLQPEHDVKLLAATALLQWPGAKHQQSQ